MKYERSCCHQRLLQHKFSVFLKVTSSPSNCQEDEPEEFSSSSCCRIMRRKMAPLWICTMRFPSGPMPFLDPQPKRGFRTFQFKVKSQLTKT